MKDYKLVNQDYKWLERIIKTTISIEALYKKLFDFETKKQKDTAEYNQTMEYLNIAIEVEDKLYEEADLDYYKCKALVDHIVGDRLPENFLNDTESIVQQDYNNRVLRRILNILVYRSISNFDSIRGILPDEIVEILEQSGIPNAGELVTKIIYNSIELQKAFEKDIFNVFLIFLQDYINNQSYSNFKEYLIRSKYYIAFINKYVEINMRSNKFEMPETFYANAKFVADSNKVDFYLLKNIYGIYEATKQIIEIMEISDLDYSDITKATTSILRQCLMRTSFLLMNDEVISNINFEFHEYIEDKKYLDRHQHDHISKQLVINCFRGIKKDRNKPGVLSLRYREN